MADVLVTGGAGFIGSNLHDVIDDPRHTCIPGGIGDVQVSGPLVERSDLVVHVAAETRVDRSILAAGECIRTDVEGTFVLLEAARRATRLRRFVQISTDEVYGSVPAGASRETKELKANPWWWRTLDEQDPAFRAYYQAQYEKRR